MVHVSEFSPTTAGVRRIFEYAKWLSPQRWLGLKCRIFAPRSMLTVCEIRCKPFTAKRARFVEYYIILWVVFELIVSLTYSCSPYILYSTAFVAVALTLRIIEIMQVTINVTLFDQMSGRSDERVASRSRLIILSGINYIELMICFGFIYAINCGYLTNVSEPVAGFYFSVITQLTIGYGDIAPLSWLRAVAAVQGLIGLLFVVLVFGRFIAALRPIKGTLDPDN